MSAPSTYDFTQGGANATWTITHSLNTQDVAVDAMVNQGSPLELKKAIPLTQVATSVNVVTLTWSSPQSGNARVVGGGIE